MKKNSFNKVYEPLYGNLKENKKKDQPVQEKPETKFSYAQNIPYDPELAEILKNNYLLSKKETRYLGDFSNNKTYLIIIAILVALIIGFIIFQQKKQLKLIAKLSKKVRKLQ